MNLPALLFVFIACVLLWRLPRCRAALPFLAAATYIPFSITIDLGPAHFTALRILVTVGLLRVMARRERMIGGWNGLDKVMIAWALCAVNSSFFHEQFTSALIFRLGLIWDCLGTYFLLRIFIRSADDVLFVCRTVILLLIPIAVEMAAESRTGNNYFQILFGGSMPVSETRDGRVRCMGPFLHSILAGTVGGACFPLALLSWKKESTLALAGVAATVTMVYTTRSSGPIMTLMVGLVGLALWKFKNYMRQIRWSAVFAIVTLAFVMNAPIYSLIGRINLTGSSSSYFRERLIASAIEHLNEWWFAGTDYTRHWMWSGVNYSSNHTDITCYYIKMGVFGGLPLMVLFIGILVAAFISVGITLRRNKDGPLMQQFMIWTLGAILFAHCITFYSISYFDQTILYLYLVLAAIGSLRGAPGVRRVVAQDGPDLAD